MSKLAKSPLKIAVVADPWQTLNFQKDTTIALLLEAQLRNYHLFYLELSDLFLQDGKVFGKAKKISIEATNYSFHVLSHDIYPLADFDIILMRKDPPFNMEYIYATYLLEKAEEAGVKVINKPSSLRSINEKFIVASHFSEISPPTLITRNIEKLVEFYYHHQNIVFKPIDGMGGRSIFLVKKADPNLKVIIETLTAGGTQTIIAQKFIPEVEQGDKRIILVNGEPVPFVLNRIPVAGEIRGNLAAGGRGEVLKLTEQDRILCQKISPFLKEKGLFFVGIDVINSYLTEINITSPTGIRQITEQTAYSIAGLFWDTIIK